MRTAPAARPHLAHPQLLNPLAEVAPQLLAKHGIELQLAIHIVPRLGMQPANEAAQLQGKEKTMLLLSQASALAKACPPATWHLAHPLCQLWKVLLQVPGKLAVDVQQQHLNLGHFPQQHT